MQDRILKYSEAEFERAVRRKVEAMFEANRTSANPSREIPIIGTLMHGYYDPRASAAEHVELVDMVVRAVIAREWFKQEAAPWAQSLPLSTSDCQALFNLGPGDHRRAIAVGEYGLYLQTMGWRIDRVQPFEVYCAHRLAGCGRCAKTSAITLGWKDG
jgi:hypothetical protein